MQTLYVKNLPSNIIKFDLQERLKSVAEKFGKIDSVVITINK